jgi:hypothetical protein
VLDNPTIAGLRFLTLGRDGDCEDFPAWLTSAPCWPALVAFHLDGGNLPPQAARQLTGALPGTRLRHLAWFRSDGPLDSQVAFLEGALRVPLESLTLAHACRFPNRVLRRLHHPSLVALDLRYGFLQTEGLAALLGHPRLPRLSALCLSGNWITGAGIRRLADSDLLARLSVLDLSGNGRRRRGRGWPDLFASANVGRLESLSLRSCRLDDALVSALARSPHLGRLQALDLSDNPLTDAGLRALADAPGLPALRYLLLRDCTVGPQMRDALCRRFAVVAP